MWNRSECTKLHAAAFILVVFVGSAFGAFLPTEIDGLNGVLQTHPRGGTLAVLS